MSAITINEHDVSSGYLQQAIRGNWACEAVVTTNDIAVGDCSIEFIGTKDSERIVYAGTITSVGEDGDSRSVSVVGGRGKLDTELPAESYEETNAFSVVMDIMLATGELVDPSSTTYLVSQRLPSWTRAKGSAKHSLSTLCDRIGAQWRVLPAGTVWIGIDTWEALPDGLFESAQPDQHGTATYAEELPNIFPGRNTMGKRIVDCVHVFGPNSFRTDVTFSTGSASERDAWAAIEGKLMRSAVPELEWLAQREGRVVSQNANGTLEIECDDPTIGGLTQVPIYLGIPGTTVKVAPNARVKVCFDAADPTKRFAGLWATATEALEIQIRAATVNVVADNVYLGDGLGRVLREGDLLSLTGCQPGAGTTATATVVTGLGLPPRASKVFA